jgi:hypothetical protein
VKGLETEGAGRILGRHIREIVTSDGVTSLYVACRPQQRESEGRDTFKAQEEEEEDEEDEEENCV